MLISPKALTLMGIVYITSCLMLGSHLFIGVGAVAIGSIIFKILIAKNIFQPLTRLDIRIITLIGIGFLTFHSIYPLKVADGFINLLLLGCALKFLEYTSRRDSYVLLSALFFLSIVPLIFHYKFYIVLYLIVIPFLTIWSFLAVTHHDSIKHDLKLLSLLILPALPLALVLFLIFPRTGSLWILPNKTQTSVGISEEMSAPGMVNLTLSDKVVGRYVFEGPIPQTRYFRTVVYDYYNGKIWRQSNRTLQELRYLGHRKLFNPNNPQYDSANQINYSILLEPAGNNFVPTLKYSSTDERNVLHITGDVYRTSVPSNNREIYHFTYYPDLRPQRSDDFNPRGLLYLPRNQNPKTFELVKSLTQNLNTDAEKVDAIYTYFSNNFKYTLTPKIPEVNQIDELLFNYRAGFCAHYSEAMAIMLRMAGIPSRIIGGYLGGSTIDNYVIVHDYDAHAWVEAYINKRWIAYDPTSLVAPGRITESILNSAQIYGANRTFMPSNKLAQLLSDIKEYIDFRWSFWVLNFNVQDQNSLFKNSIITMGIIFIAGLLITTTIMVLNILRRRRTPLAPEQILLKKALKVIAERGFILKEHENIITFNERLKDTRIGELTGKFFDAYIALRYKNTPLKERSKYYQELKTTLALIKKQ